jgi:hypothetical protein
MNNATKDLKQSKAKSKRGKGKKTTHSNIPPSSKVSGRATKAKSTKKLPEEEGSELESISVEYLRPSSRSEPAVKEAGKAGKWEPH